MTNTTKLMIIIIVVLACLAIGWLIIKSLKKIWKNRGEYDKPFIEAFRERQDEHIVIKMLYLALEPVCGGVFIDNLSSTFATVLPSQLKVDFDHYYENSDPNGLINAILRELRLWDGYLDEFLIALGNSSDGFLGDLSNNVTASMEMQVESIDSIPISQLAKEYWENRGGTWENLSDEDKMRLIFYTLWNNLKIPPCIKKEVNKSLRNEGSEEFKSPTFILAIIGNMAIKKNDCPFFSSGDEKPCEMCNENPAFCASLCTPSETDYITFP